MQLNYNKSYLCYKVYLCLNKVLECIYFEFEAKLSKCLRFRLPTTIGPALDTVPSCNNRGLLTRAAAMPNTAALANGMRKLLAKSALCDNSDRFFEAIDFCAIGRVYEYCPPEPGYWPSAP
ncbi:hypothetical protein GQX74_007358 [Glossina fuscipes]|nr:hypothetical protein GQX74_007358 [Glossina fuscipes]